MREGRKSRPIRVKISTFSSGTRPASRGTATNATDPHLWGYASEKLGAAVYVLATHTEEVRRRLYSAFEHFAMVPAPALPPSLHAQYDAILTRLLRDEPATRGLSRLNWNLHHMRKSTGQKLAEQIVRLDSEVEALL